MMEWLKSEWNKVVSELEKNKSKPIEPSVSNEIKEDKEASGVTNKYVLIIPWLICLLCKIITYIVIIGFIAGIFFDLIGYEGYSDRTSKLLSYFYAYGPYSMLTIFLYGVIFYIGIYGEKSLRNLYKNSK